MSPRLQVDKAVCQVNKAVCQGFLDVGRRHDGPGSVTEGFITPGRATTVSLVRFMSATPFLGPSGQCRESQVAGTSLRVCHKRGILSLDSQPFAPERDTVSPKPVCLTPLTRWYITEAVSAPAPKAGRTVQGDLPIPIWCKNAKLRNCPMPLSSLPFFFSPISAFSSERSVKERTQSLEVGIAGVAGLKSQSASDSL